MIDAPAKEFAEQVQRSIGGPIQSMRRELRVLCPVHEADGSSHHPSLAVWARPEGGVAFNCMAVCPWGDVRKALAARGIVVPRAERQCGREEEGARKAERRRQARALWDAATPLTDGDPSMLYLGRRRIVPQDREMLCFRTIRRSPEVERGLATAEVALPVGWPIDGALFAQAVARPAGWLGNDRWPVIGLQLTFLSADGIALRRDGKTVRRIVGSRRGGGVVIGKARSVAVIGEGVETTWSAMRLLGGDFGIATIGALDQLDVPSFVDHVVISVDGDMAGEAAAARARQRWQSARRTVTLKQWGTTIDANDVLIQGGHGNAGR